MSQKNPNISVPLFPRQAADAALARVSSILAGGVSGAAGSGGAERVEVVDARDRPVAMLPLEEVHRQGLGHRAVIVLLYDARGRLYLRKRGPGRRLFPGRWDVSAAGHVRVGESREEAAHRHLERDLGVRASRLTLRMAVPASTATGNEFVTLYAAVRVREVPASAASEDGMFVDRDELAYLAEQCRDLLTPALVHCWETGLVFPPSSLP